MFYLEQIGSKLAVAAVHCDRPEIERLVRKAQAYQFPEKEEFQHRVEILGKATDSANYNSGLSAGKIRKRRKFAKKCQDRMYAAWQHPMLKMVRSFELELHKINISPVE